MRLSRPHILWIIATILLLLTLRVNYELWLAPANSWNQIGLLQNDVDVITAQNDRLALRNQGMQAEIVDLSARNDAVEGLARTELGLIQRGETLFRPRPRNR